MAAKQFELSGVGTIFIYKRRGSKNIRLSVNSDGKVRVTQPTWLPYTAGITFATQKRGWLQQQQPLGSLSHKQRLGKYHTLYIMAKAGINSPQTRVTKTEVLVYHPVDANNRQIETAAHNAAKRAMRAEAEQLLPQRLRELATQYNFKYTNLSIRHLKSRWGSCSSKHAITLNYYLMQLPWDLIDYVLIHELAHTRQLNHSAEFWQTVGDCLPNYKRRRKQLKEYQPSLLTPKSTRSVA